MEPTVILSRRLSLWSFSMSYFPQALFFSDEPALYLHTKIENPHIASGVPLAGVNLEFNFCCAGLSVPCLAILDAVDMPDERSHGVAPIGGGTP